GVDQLLSAELPAVGDGHHEVEENQLRPLAGGEAGQGRAPVGCCDDAIALAFEKVGKRETNRLVVIDHHDERPIHLSPEVYKTPNPTPRQSADHLMIAEARRHSERASSDRGGSVVRIDSAAGEPPKPAGG